MRYLVFLGVLLLGPTMVRPQGPPNAGPTPDTGLTRQIEWQQIRRRLDNLDALRKNKTVAPRPDGYDSGRIILELLYRRSRNDERQLLIPEVEDGSRFAEFLKQPDTGLTKLIRDFGCDEYSTEKPNEQICSRFTMPGGGSAFSFRVADYQQWKLADLLYDGKSFIVFGQMSLGMVVDLGKVPLDLLTTENKGLAYLVGFDPSGNIEEATKQNTALADGVTDKGVLYKKFLPVVPGDTYALRSVAFRGSVTREHNGTKYNELDFDKRKDIVVAFQVVRQDFNGTVTILWKILQTKQSPVLSTTK